MSRDDYQYYAMRARQEEKAALIATCDAARERHEELAEAYRFRCELIRDLSRPIGAGPHQAPEQALVDHQ